MLCSGALEVVTAVASLQLLPAFGGRRRNKAGFLRVCCNKACLGVIAVLSPLCLVEMSGWVQNLMTERRIEHMIVQTASP